MDHSNNSRAVIVKRSVKRLVFYLFMTIGGLLIGYQIVVTRQEGRYIAHVLQLYENKQDYRAAANRKPFLVSDKTKRFILFYIQELEKVDSHLIQLRTACTISDRGLRSNKLKEIEIGLRKEHQSLSFRLEQAGWDCGYMQNACAQLTNYYQKIFVILDKCREDNLGGR